LLFENMAILDKKEGELLLVLKPNIVSGDEIVFNVCVNNGSFTKKYGFTKIFGATVKLFEDDCETMDNWKSISWGITTLQYASPTHSIADSPFGNYPNYANTTIYSKNSYDLPEEAFAAYAEFSAQWEIEASYDYVQFLVSENNGTTWVPQHGKYTKLGGIYQDPHKPLYDGNQYAWVRETIDLSPYKGKSIKVGFRLRSDEYLNYDGFYFDDFVLSVIMPQHIDTVTIQDNNRNSFTAYYNATTKKIIINNIDRKTDFSLFNVEGKLIDSFNVSKNNYEINVSQFRSGIYFLKTNFGKIQKMVIY